MVSLPEGHSIKCLLDDLKLNVSDFGLFRRVIYPLSTWLHQTASFFEASPVFRVDPLLQSVHLDSKQRKILELLISGETNKEIANIINLYEQGLEYHVGILLEKFTPPDRNELRAKLLKI